MSFGGKKTEQLHMKIDRFDKLDINSWNLSFYNILLVFHFLVLEIKLAVLHPEDMTVGQRKVWRISRLVF